MNALLPCPVCSQYIRGSEYICPFCSSRVWGVARMAPASAPTDCGRGGNVPADWSASCAPAATLVPAAAFLAVTLLACSAYGAPPVGPFEEPIPNGGVAIAGKCRDNEYVGLPEHIVDGMADDDGPCSFLPCAQPTCRVDTAVNYAVCVDGGFSSCACTPPEGGVEIVPDGAPVVPCGDDQ